MHAPRGRGTGENPANRFENLHFETDEDAWVDEDPRPVRTTFLRDDSQTIINRNTADDLSFEFSVNPYRGCEHGCAYCFARTYHEYLGYSAGLDFESKIIVKENAPELLEKELAKKSYIPGKIAISGVTDCYQPIERKLQITRRCLGVMARFRQPVAMITKNALITRDIDHLAELAKYRAAAAILSVTTLDPQLARILEPRASSPRARLDAIRELAAAGIPVGVSCAPMIPGLNDSELPAILTTAKQAGASFAFYSMVRLPGAVATVFSAWLDQHFPDKKMTILNRIRETHHGKLNSSIAFERRRGAGVAADQTRAIFKVISRRLGIEPRPPELSTASFRRLSPGQDELF
ncbi:MAG: Radical [Akkermansiaceae bacterium]|nr:Radical [Akkermansiaceae bacterium]